MSSRPTDCHLPWCRRGRRRNTVGRCSRIVVGDDLAGRLVIRQDPRRRRHDAHPHRLAVDLDPVAEGDALAGVRRLAVDRDPALDDQVFHVAARADAGLGQHLVQLRRIGLGGEHPLARGLLGLDRRLGVGVELAGQDLGEDLAGLGRRDRLQVQRQRAFEVRRQRQRPPRPVAVAAARRASPPSPRRRSRRPRRRLRSPRSPLAAALAVGAARRRRRSSRPRLGARRRIGAGAPRRRRRRLRSARTLRRRRRVAAFEIALRHGVVRSVHGWVPERGRRAWRGNRVGVRSAGSASASASPAASANDSEDCGRERGERVVAGDRRVAGAVERRQLVEALQAEVVEQLAGRGEQRRPAGRLAVADRLDPAAVLELLDDRAGDGDAADVLDVAAGHRLAVGDDRQRLQHRARIARRPLGAQARQVGGHLRAALEAPAARQLDQVDALVRVLAGRARRAARARCRCRSRRRTARRSSRRDIGWVEQMSAASRTRLASRVFMSS